MGEVGQARRLVKQGSVGIWLSMGGWDMRTTVLSCLARL